MQSVYNVLEILRSGRLGMEVCTFDQTQGAVK
jgi:hypothetical protein